VARTARAASRAQTLRGKASSAGRPIWNGRLDEVGEPASARTGSGCGAAVATAACVTSAGVTMVPAWPRVST
jgi:hypothetical protein